MSPLTQKSRICMCMCEYGHLLVCIYIYVYSVYMCIYSCVVVVIVYLLFYCSAHIPLIIFPTAISKQAFGKETGIATSAVANRASALELRVKTSAVKISTCMILV